MNTHQRPKIFIVDDNPINIQVLSNVLIKHDFEVMVAKDGEKAIQQLQRIQPDLVLLDVMMPGLMGLKPVAVCKQMTSRKVFPSFL
ncbi:MAG: response regulator [Leptolyngbyaceae cyanobacterium CRU_2_3]|nr:response regulator [Leptolyngbyaceae cyanobacterium CRU_2_3]